MVQIYHVDIFGVREEKEKVLSQEDISTIRWHSVNIQKPFYLFIPQNIDLKEEYDQGCKIIDIMSVNSVGMITGQDARTIAMSKNDANTFANSHEISQQQVKPVLYRPFDYRFVVYDSKVITRPQRKVMQHMLIGENLGLILARQTREKWNALVSSQIIGHKSLAAYDINSLFPLYLYSDTIAEEAMGMKKRPNLSPDFLNKISEKLGYTPTPEAIFYYIYAILHSPTYRTRYAEFLKIDFPRVPLTSCDTLFRQLATYGEELVALHLMKSAKLDNLITQFVEDRGDRLVDTGHPKFSNGEVVINKKGDKFTGVSESVWNFHVGGYQVCQKWLKDRKGRTLSNEDIQHYQRIVLALQETIHLMQQIDEAIPEFPLK